MKPIRSKPFSIPDAKNRATRILSQPPARPWIVRPEPRGELVAGFYLPPELCKPSNHTRHRSIGHNAKDKDALWGFMSQQWLKQRAGAPSLPLGGRPQVICVRFTSKAPDAVSDWAKFAVDMLMVAKDRKVTKGGVTRLVRDRRRLGIITEDNPEAIELHQYWEPAPPKDGVCLVRVFTGEES